MARVVNQPGIERAARPSVASGDAADLAAIPAPGSGGRRSWLARHTWLALTVPAVLFMLVVFVYPLARILLRSVFDPGFTTAHYQEMIANPAYARVLVNTFQISVVVTVLSLLFGYPVAYVLSQLRGIPASLLIAGVVLPLWTSELVRSFAWTIILGRKGPVNDALERLGLIERPLALLFNAIAVYIGTTHIMLPFMVLPLYSVMRSIDPRLRQAALSMGATPLEAFRSVFLPLSMPGVVSGCLLVFVLATGFFVTPSILGSTDQTMIAMLIETEARRSLNWGMASALAVALLVVTAVILAIYDRLFGLDRLQVGGVQ
jgi:ABC-type spermidine/putrescine transport system permease subunit I